DPRVVPGTLVVVDVESVEDPDSSALEEPPPPRGVLEQFEQFSGIASGVEVDDVDDRLGHDAAESVLDHGPVVLGWQHVEDEMLEDPVLDESWEGDVPVGRLGPGEDGESDRSGAGQFGQDALRSRVEQMRVVDEDHLRGAGRGEHRDDATQQRGGIIVEVDEEAEGAEVDALMHPIAADPDPVCASVAERLCRQQGLADADLALDEDAGALRAPQGAMDQLEFGDPSEDPRVSGG